MTAMWVSRATALTVLAFTERASVAPERTAKAARELAYWVRASAIRAFSGTATPDQALRAVAQAESVCVVRLTVHPTPQCLESIPPALACRAPVRAATRWRVPAR